MKTQSYDNSIKNTTRVVKSPWPGSLADPGLVPGPGQPGNLIRAERTPGAVAVSGKTETGVGAYDFSSGFPQTNSKPSVKSGGFSIDGLAPLEWSADIDGGGCFGPVGDLSGVILEYVAKRSVEANGGLIKVCPTGVITGSCENGHRFAKEVYCGKEWCKICNGKWEKHQDPKPSHARRFARWYPKAQQIASLGYFTFTVPLELRTIYRSKKSLSKLGRDVRGLLKSFGFERGLCRFHWFGDKSKRWNPHINCLVDGGFIGRRELRSIRREYSRLLGVKLAIAEYHYLTSPGEKVHALTYVTRATFLDPEWDPNMARELHGFRNQLWWGSKLWNREPVWSLDDLPGKQQSEMSDTDTKAVAALELGYCPYDGLTITWDRWQPIRMLSGLGGREIGSGYWELPYVRPPPYRRALLPPEVIEARYGKLAKTIGGSYVSADIAGQRWAEFGAQHKRAVADHLWRKALESGDEALIAEFLSRTKNSSQIIAPLGVSHSPGKAVRKPNCLGGVSVVGKN